MVNEIRNPHDAFFKQLFSQPDQAEQFLSTFLPTEISSHLDLMTLESQPESFVDADLQSHYSDLLYKVSLHNGQLGYLYLLFEHKSYPDRRAILQLLEYQLRIWQQVASKPPWPVVLPILFYHGASRWTYPTAFQAFFEVPRTVAAVYSALSVLAV